MSGERKLKNTIFLLLCFVLAPVTFLKSGSAWGLEDDHIIVALEYGPAKLQSVSYTGSTKASDFKVALERGKRENVLAVDSDFGKWEVVDRNKVLPRTIDVNSLQVFKAGPEKLRLLFYYGSETNECESSINGRNQSFVVLDVTFNGEYSGTYYEIEKNCFINQSKLSGLAKLSN